MFQVHLLLPWEWNDEDDLVASYDPGFSRAAKLPPCQPTSGDTIKLNCNRATPGFITGVVGDVSTCKTNCGVMSRAD